VSMGAIGTDNVRDIWRVKLSLTEHVLDDTLVLFAKNIERVPAGLASRYWIRFNPSTACELVEVIARIDCVVDGVENGARLSHARLRCTQSLYKQAHRQTNAVRPL